MKLKADSEEINQLLKFYRHDIFQHLRNLEGLINVLEEDCLPAVPESQLVFKMSKNTCKNAFKTVNFFNRYFSLIKDEFQLQSINIYDLCRSLKNSNNDFLEENHVKLDINVNMTLSLTGNSSLLLDCFSELLTNSVQYNNSQSPSLKITSASNEHYIILYFQDNGMGLPLEKSFEIFKFGARYHENNDTYHLGAGLCAAAKIMEIHNGKIELESSKQGSGSTFALYFPIN